MHFALPPRKTSHPPPYARYRSRPPLLRRSRLRSIAIIACGALAVLLLFFRLSRSASDRPPPGTPPVVIVTPVDEDMFSRSYISKIKKNRDRYAARHGMVKKHPTRMPSTILAEHELATQDTRPSSPQSETTTSKVHQWGGLECPPFDTPWL